MDKHLLKQISRFMMLWDRQQPEPPQHKAKVPTKCIFKTQGDAILRKENYGYGWNNQQIKVNHKGIDIQSIQKIIIFIRHRY